MPLTQAASCAASRAARSNRNAIVSRNARVASAWRLSKPLCHSRSGQSRRGGEPDCISNPLRSQSVNCSICRVLFLQFSDSAAARGGQISGFADGHLRPPRVKRWIMALQINDIAPDFEADTTEGRIHFHDWIGNSWAVLFSHPKDFTPVCTTELGYMAKLKPEFDRRNTKIIGLSVDPVSDHTRWAQDIKETQGYAPNYPMIGDPDLKISKAYGMLPASAGSSSQGRKPADNQTVRKAFGNGPDKRIKLNIPYPITTGRHFHEGVRVRDSLQLTTKH